MDIRDANQHEAELPEDVMFIDTVETALEVLTEKHSAALWFDEHNMPIIRFVLIVGKDNKPLHYKDSRIAENIARVLMAEHYVEHSCAHSGYCISSDGIKKYSAFLKEREQKALSLLSKNQRVRGVNFRCLGKLSFWIIGETNHPRSRDRCWYFEDKKDQHFAVFDDGEIIKIKKKGPPKPPA